GTGGAWWAQRGGFPGFPCDFDFVFDLDFGWWSVVEVFLTTLSCSLRRCGQEHRNGAEPPSRAGRRGVRARTGRTVAGQPITRVFGWCLAAVRVRRTCIGLT